ncbi:MAG: hypothetical protein ACLPWS_07890 [Rhodomicrobium sp.]
MRLRPMVPALFMAFAVAFVPASLAQDTLPAEVHADPEVKQAARSLIEDLLHASHAAEIFSELRLTLREVYIPAIRDLVQGATPGIPAPDAKTAAALAKLLTFMDYVRKAGDELDAALSQNRDAMISDAAEQIAKTAKPVEIKDVQGLLKLPAVRKSLDAFYAISKLVTGFSYEDSRTFSGFSAWAGRQDLDVQQALPGTPGSGLEVPSKHKIAKAQAFVNDLFAISHADEIVADLNRFLRDVYTETAPMAESDREELREETEQFEFLYNMQKAVVLAAAPSVVAATLNDEQLAILHGFVRSPAFAKLFDLIRNAVKSATAFTKGDIVEVQKSLEELESKAKLHQRGAADQDRSKAQWDELIGKWEKILKNRISPETRDGLEQSLEDLQNEGLPI